MAYCHVWFSTRRPKWLLLDGIEQMVKQAIMDVASENGICLLECQTMVEHVHLLVDCPPADLPKTIQLLKGVSARRLFLELPELKLDAKTQHLWQKRYGAKEVPTAALESVRTYIRTQEDRPEKFDRPPGFHRRS